MYLRVIKLEVEDIFAISRDAIKWISTYLKFEDCGGEVVVMGVVA